MLPFNQQQTLSPMRIMTRRSRPNSSQSRGGGNYYPHRGQQMQMRRTVRVGDMPSSLVNASLSNSDNSNNGQQMFAENYHSPQRRPHHLLANNNNARGGRGGRGRGNLRSRGGGAKRYGGQARSSHINNNNAPQLAQQIMIGNVTDMVAASNGAVNGVVTAAVPRRYPMRRSRNSVSNLHESHNNTHTVPAAQIENGVIGFRNGFSSLAPERSISPQKLPLLPTPDANSGGIQINGDAQIAEKTPSFTHRLQQQLQTGRRRRSPRGKGGLRPQQQTPAVVSSTSVQELSHQPASSTQAEPPKVEGSEQHQPVVGGGPLRAGRHRFRNGNNYPYKKPVGFAHKIRKPYHELTWEEKKKIAAAEERKAELRQQRYEEFGKRKSAPHNTTQYIIDQSEADATEFQKKTKKHSALHEVTDGGDAQSAISRAVHEESSVAADGESDGDSDNEYDYDKSLEREFDEQYDKVQQSRLGKMSKAELVEHCTSLESEREYLVGKLARLEIDFQGVRAENERMKKEQLELQAGSIVTRRGGVGGGGFVQPSIPHQPQISSSVQHGALERQDSLYGSDDAHSSSEMSSSNVVARVPADGSGAAAQLRGVDVGEVHDGVFVQPSMHRMQTRNAHARTEQQLQQQQQHHLIDHFGPSSSGGSSAGGKSGGGGADDDNRI